MIVRHLSNNQLDYVEENAFDTWSNLSTTYERNSITNQVIARKNLLQMKFNGNGSLVKFFEKFDSAINVIKLAKSEMDDTDVIVHLLLTLPASYSPNHKRLRTRY